MNQDFALSSYYNKFINMKAITIILPSFIKHEPAFKLIIEVNFITSYSSIKDMIINVRQTKWISKRRVCR